MISLPKQPKITKKDKNKATFEIEALYPGYGITIGNSLRRVLLSSLEGAAITQVKIKGAPHEFSTIAGVLEDIIMVTLNLKQLRFRLLSNEPQKATLKVKGEKAVKGGDFKLPSQVELINKDCHIATLTSKSAELDMEIQIEKGTGYSSRESRQKEKVEIGAIPMDAIFTPTKKVSYRVESMRVGERTDYDRLSLEIETDGIVSPEEAFYQAANTLLSHFTLLSESFQPKAAVVKPAEKEKKKAIKKPVAQKTVKVKTTRKIAKKTKKK